MLAAIITLSLLSLLVATEADPSGTHADTTASEPLRPSCKLGGDKDHKNPDRLAA